MEPLIRNRTLAVLARFGRLTPLARGLALLLGGLALLFGGLALLAGCNNPFTPTTPEKPDKNAIVESFTSPANLLNTMQAGMQARSSVGRQAWTDALADSTVTPGVPSFYAFPYIGVLDAWEQHNDAPPSWTLSMERRFYDWVNTNYYATSDFSYGWAWDTDNTQPLDVIDLSAGTALLHRHYTLEAQTPDGSNDHVICIGYVDLYMVRSSGRWYLYRWEDRVDPDFGIGNPDMPTIGQLRLDSHVW